MTSQQLKALIDELRKPQYQSLGDQEALDMVDSMTVRVKRKVPVVDVKQWAIEEAIYAQIVLGQQSPDERIKRICISIVGWIDDAGGRVQNVDLDKQTAIDMMQGLVHFGIATETQIQRLRSLQWVTLKWTESVGVGTLDVQEIAKLRERINLGIS
jgi:hypothetical protein